MTNREQVFELRRRMIQSIIGQDHVVDRLLLTLLCNGNALLEGLPGLAKTRAIKTLVKNLQSDFSRIQFTPDLLPSDVTGAEIYLGEESAFKQLRRINHNNDVIAVLVHDPNASNLPFSRDFVVTNCELQVELPMGEKKRRERLQESSSGRIAEVLQLQNRLQMPVLPLSTAEDVSGQLHRLLGTGVVDFSFRKSQK